MTRKLKAGRFGPQSGKTTSVVVFLHGYGSNGADLLGLAEPMSGALADTLFVAPDGPEPSRGNPMGFQWFSVPRFDGSSETEMAAGFARSADDINAFLDEILAETGLSADRLALVGFSQGSVMSMQIAPRRAEAIGGVVAFSGRMIAPEKLAAEAVSKPPVLLVHGDQDPVMPIAEMKAAGDALVGAGIETYAHVERGCAHSIAQDGFSVALSFLQDRLG